MNDQLLEDSVWMLSQARGVGFVLRLLIVATPFLAIASVNAAGHADGALTLAIAVTTVACVLVPDSHAGLIVVVLISVQWVAAVDDTTSPWVLAAAASMTVFHAALAAASAIPAGATWSTAMRRRWSRRPLVLIVASVATWGAVLVVDTIDPANSAVLVTAALIVLAAAGLWATRASDA